MTPEEMLAPQPPPSGHGDSVTNWLLMRLGLGRQGGSPATPDEFDRVEALLVARRAQCWRKYGMELRMGNGREARADALQEAVDLLLYLAQDLIEREGVDAEPVLGSYALVRIGVAIRMVVELSSDLVTIPVRVPGPTPAYDRMVNVDELERERDHARDEVERLQARISQLEDDAGMACETPATGCDCAGCTYAAERAEAGTL